MRVPAKLSELLEIYVDESSQTNHRYFVLGSIVLQLSKSQRVAELILQARLPELPAGEAKWVKVSRTKLPAYKRIVDVIFDNQDIIRFHSLFVDTSKLDHTRYNSGDREVGFNKEIFLLANKISQLHSRHYFHLYLDYRNTNQKPDELRLILNRACQKRQDERDWPFRRSHFLNSANTPQLQLADILIGAIAFQLNGHALAVGASPAKIELSEYVLDKAGIADITRGTKRDGKFTVWPRKLK